MRNSHYGPQVTGSPLLRYAKLYNQPHISGGNSAAGQFCQCQIWSLGTMTHQQFFEQQQNDQQDPRSPCPVSDHRWFLSYDYG